jgi:predicted PurR-regulated permease PerM
MSDTTSDQRLSPGAKALTLAIVAFVALLLYPYLSGLVGALVLYTAAAPLIAFVRARARGPRAISVAVVVATFLLIVLPLVWLFVGLLAQVPDALRSIEASRIVQRMVTLHVGGVDVGGAMRVASTELVAWSSRQTMGFIGGTVRATLNLMIALFGAYYLLVSDDGLWRRVRDLLPFCPTMSELLRVRFHRVTEAMVLGVVVTGAAQGALVTLGFTVLGFDHALFWGAVTAAASVLPLFGSALIWLTASIVLFAQGRFGASVGLLVFGVIVISNVDNALRMVVYKRVGSIHPMITLVGAFAGVSAFGIAGLLIGPLMLSYAVELLSVYRAPDSIALAAAA